MPGAAQPLKGGGTVRNACSPLPPCSRPADPEPPHPTSSQSAWRAGFLAPSFHPRCQALLPLPASTWLAPSLHQRLLNQNSSIGPWGRASPSTATKGPSESGEERKPPFSPVRGESVKERVAPPSFPRHRDSGDLPVPGPWKTTGSSLFQGAPDPISSAVKLCCGQRVEAA